MKNSNQKRRIINRTKIVDNWAGFLSIMTLAFSPFWMLALQ